VGQSGRSRHLRFPTSATIGARKFDTGEPAAAQIARLATTLVPGAPPRFERLRGFGAGVGSALTCACSHIVLGDGTPAILVVAAERAGPDLPLDERVRRLLADCHEPIAAFSTDGRLVAGTESGQLHLRGTTSLAALDAQNLPPERSRAGTRRDALTAAKSRSTASAAKRPQC
jgi:hypothetical protein